MDDRALLQLAFEAREMAYAPYSRFRVGVALATERGEVYTGINIENASFGATNCAERTAVFKAVAAGDRKLAAIAIAAGGDDIPYPCGICLQVLAEFGGAGLRIICGSSGGGYEVHTLGELLPRAFKIPPRRP
jgi:cytidine deaminase